MKLTKPMRRVLTDLATGRYTGQRRYMTRGNYSMIPRDPYADEPYFAVPGAVTTLVSWGYLAITDDGALVVTDAGRAARAAN